MESERAGSGNVANGGFVRVSMAFDSIEHPFQNANILSVSRPQKFSTGVAPEPIHMEYSRRIFHATPHLEPVTEVIGHVVAAEGKHRHRIPARDSNGAGRGRRGLGSHRGANVPAVLPSAGLKNGGSDARTAAAENHR